MDTFVPFLGGWFWLVASGLLLILELSAPGVFFIWLAIAAFLTAIADRLMGFSWQGELLTFATFSVAAIYIGKPLLRRQRALDSDQPTLNRRMDGYVGQSFVLERPITDGRGRLKINDTLWDVTGPDLPAGARVTVTAVDGLKLRVAAA